MNRLLRILLRNLHRLPGAYGKLCRYARQPEQYPEGEKWDHVRYLFSLAVDSANVTLEVTGQEHIPAQGGFMLYANHQGLFDVVAIGATCPRPLGAVYKKELRDTPLLKQIYACTQSYAMDREDVRQSLTVIQAVTREVEKGRAYLIFPEGTRSRNGNQMGPFHGGSFRCATKSRCPILPVALTDTHRVFDSKGSAPVKARLQYLPPISWEEYGHMKPAEVAALVKARIQAAIEDQGP